MRRFCTIVGSWTILAAVACSDGPMGVVSEPEDSTTVVQPPAITIAELIVSNALPAPAAGGGTPGHQVAYVSLPPATLPHVSAVRLRNLSAQGAAVIVPVLGGGFDPIAVPGKASDGLELTLAHENGSTSVAHATIPARRAPLVVRADPRQGGVNVAWSVRPRVIFSEPIDSGTLAAGMRLSKGGTVLSTSVMQDADAPWSVELVPSDPLESETEYELHVTAAIRDLDGDALAPHTSAFTSAIVLLEGEIAFVTNRDGTNHIYVASADGSDVARVAKGAFPAWSHDGRHLAFQREASSAGPAGLYVIGVGESDLRYLGPGFGPAWSSDGRIAFISGWPSGTTGNAGLSVMNADGSGVRRVLDVVAVLTSWGAPATWLPNYQIGRPAWSPDGRSLWFLALANAAGGDWDPGWHLGIVGADGANPRQVEGFTELSRQSGLAWSPDGGRIAVIIDPGPWQHCDGWLGQCWPGTGFEKGSAIYTYQVGSDMTLGGRTEVYTHPAFRAFNPAWSPDGSQLLFSADFAPEDASPGRRLFAVVLQTGEVRQLVPDAIDPANADYHDWGAAWRP